MFPLQGRVEGCLGTHEEWCSSCKDNKVSSLQGCAWNNRLMALSCHQSQACIRQQATLRQVNTVSSCCCLAQSLSFMPRLTVSQSVTHFLVWTCSWNCSSAQIETKQNKKKTQIRWEAYAQVSFPVIHSLCICHFHCIAWTVHLKPKISCVAQRIVLRPLHYYWASKRHWRLWTGGTGTLGW